MNVQFLESKKLSFLHLYQSSFKRIIYLNHLNLIKNAQYYLEINKLQFTIKNLNFNGLIARVSLLTHKMNLDQLCRRDLIITSIYAFN